MDKLKIKGENMRPNITIYTDGSWRQSQKLGGWAAFLICGHHKEVIFDSQVPNTTNNRMELTAVIQGLSKLKYQSNVVIVSDSKYVINGATSWINNWKTNDWKTTAGTDVVNRDLWEQLDALMKNHYVSFKWIKGHLKNMNSNKDGYGNMLVDYFASTVIC